MTRAPRSSEVAAELGGEIRVPSRPSHHEAQPDPAAPSVVVDLALDDEPTARRRPIATRLAASERVKARIDTTATQHLDPKKRDELIRRSKERG